MIDDEQEVQELLESFDDYLPMRAYATPRLVHAVGQGTAHLRVNDPVKIDSVLYLGDEGGISCSIGLREGKSVVITSLTHLRFDLDHPLAKQIQAYQSRRTQRLGGPPTSHSSSRERAKLAAKLKRKGKARR